MTISNYHTFSMFFIRVASIEISSSLNKAATQSN